VAKLKHGERGPWETRAKFKKSGQGAGRKVSKQMMNKHKRRGYKAYRGQGR